MTVTWLQLALGGKSSVSCSLVVVMVTDMGDLEQKLAEASDARLKLIVSDGVFSMDGSITPLG